MLFCLIISSLILLVFQRRYARGKRTKLSPRRVCFRTAGLLEPSRGSLSFSFRTLFSIFIKKIKDGAVRVWEGGGGL